MKKNYLLICNKSLLLLMPFVLASGVLLECLHGGSFCRLDNTCWVSLHIVLSMLLSLFVLWHVRLNWGNVCNWYMRLARHRSRGFRFTFIIFLLAVLTGLLSIASWLCYGHTPLGGWHGKIGLVCTFFMFGHTVRHRRWYSKGSRD